MLSVNLSKNCILDEKTISPFAIVRWLFVLPILYHRSFHSLRCHHWLTRSDISLPYRDLSCRCPQPRNHEHTRELDINILRTIIYRLYDSC